MTLRKGKTLKARLLQIVVTTMLVTGVCSLSAVAWVNYVIERDRLTDIERHIAHAISGKGSTLATSHALALKGLVLDNVFSDVRGLVSSAVHGDPDLTYGLFIASDGKPWAYVSPKHTGTEARIPDDVLQQLQLDPAARPIRRLSERHLSAFGQDIHEFAAPVLGDDGEPLGTIVYGFSNRRTQQAVAAAGERSRTVLLRAFLSLGAVSLLSLGAGIAWVLRSAARVTGPLARLTAAANEIAGGKRGLRVSIQSGDEVELLASALNHMLEANDDAMRKLEATTERALAADRLKSEFLANTSHEIRTPMNGVLGMIRLIQALPLDRKLKRYVDTIEASANALLTIIDDILDFSKMEAGKYTLQSLPFEPHLVVQEVAELLASRAHGKGVDLVCRMASDLPEPVIGDPDRFRQVLNNLVGNAIKFTDRGEVFVGLSLVTQAEQSVVASVTIKDTGIGIDTRDLPRLYQAFSQVDGSMMRKHGGTGLGLAISKRLVSMMGGDIQVQSQLGAGSLFSFTARFGLPDTAAKPGKEAPAGWAERRVLVVDGSASWQTVLIEQLEAWRLRVQATGELPIALGLVRAAEVEHRPFDAVIVSADPGADALAEFVGAIRRQPASARLPLLLLTTTTTTSVSAELEPEFVTLLHKPPRSSDLYNALARALSPNLEKAPPRIAAPKPQKRVIGAPILVVDDNDINRYVAVEQLAQSGYGTEEARNGVEALEKLSKRTYQCVLMDCQMPVMDGYEATRRIRALEAEQRRKRTPIIALTAHALVGERERVIAAGMDDFLSKPFRPSSLGKLLDHHAEPGEPAAMDLARGPRDLDPSNRRSEKLIRLFLEQMPEELQALRDAAARADAATVRVLAHKIKGSALALTAERMSVTAEILQLAAEAQALEQAAGFVEELSTQYDAVVLLLEAELATHTERPPRPPASSD